MASDAIIIRCCLTKRAEDPLESFSIKVSRDDFICDMQQAVWETRKAFLKGQCQCSGPGELVLYKLRRPEPVVPSATLSERLGQQEAALSDLNEELYAEHKISDHFPEQCIGCVEVLVRGCIRPTKKRLRKGSDSGDSHPDVKRLKVIDDRITAVEQGILARDPSGAAYYVNLSSEQHKCPIKNGRPVDQIGPPLAIYHPVFAKFKDLSANQKIKPSATEYALAHELLAIAAYIHSEYGDLDARFERMEPILRKLLDDTIAPEIGLCRTTNGICLLTETLSPSAAGLRAVIEVKNEIGTDQCDASMKGGMSYRKYWVHELMEPIRNACCCPSFIITMSGPWICVLGAVFVDEVIVQPLTECMWLGGEPDCERQISSTARTFHVLSSCLRDLDQFYRTLEPSRTLVASALFPYFISYASGGQEVRLTYERALLPKEERPGKAVFVATTEFGEPMMVKFTERYCKAAHMLLAERELAPPLRYCEYFGGGLYAVVMDFLPGQNLAVAQAMRPRMGDGTKTDKPVRVLADVKEAVERLHEHGYVFGDLRASNIMLHVREVDTESRDGRADVEGAMLVDFDWCGIEPDARYPVGLNDTGDIAWPPGVERGGIMQKEHDMWLLNQLVFD
ncbi:hypothetical protein A0H81_14490 [Grifola frondosa]|uniref:Protein kinase domain-containing protein n=1 Tax=Grifola frondosa TaxID=5627 RepID=A0A1C7LLJ3_GRIFR|nr:hypothetical protein A0H81_14490 [Grifola frondosa]